MLAFRVNIQIISPPLSMIFTRHDRRTDESTNPYELLRTAQRAADGKGTWKAYLRRLSTSPFSASLEQSNRKFIVFSKSLCWPHASAIAEGRTSLSRVLNSFSTHPPGYYGLSLREKVVLLRNAAQIIPEGLLGLEFVYASLDF